MHWNALQMESTVGTPWEPQPGSEGSEIKSKIRMKTEQEVSDGLRIPEGEKKNIGVQV